MRAYLIVAGLVVILGAAALAQSPSPRLVLPGAQQRLTLQCATSDTDCDGDGDPRSEDCNDRDPSRFHGNIAELNRSDNVDNDCDPSTLGPDADRDGHQVSGACNPQPDGAMLCGTDCDDTRRTLNPSAIEACDTVDNDCDGSIDEGLQGTFFADADGDGFGAGRSLHMCVAPGNASLRGSDCDDGNPLTHPGQFELQDGIDNNCNGAADERPVIAPRP